MSRLGINGLLKSLVIKVHHCRVISPKWAVFNPKFFSFGRKFSDSSKLKNTIGPLPLATDFQHAVFVCCAAHD